MVILIAQTPYSSLLPLEQLNHAIHSSLIIREQVPGQYAYARVEEGVLHLVDADNFALSLMLESPEPASAPWRLLNIQLLFPPQVTLAEISPSHPSSPCPRYVSDSLLIYVTLRHREGLTGAETLFTP